MENREIVNSQEYDYLVSIGYSGLPKELLTRERAIAFLIAHNERKVDFKPNWLNMLYTYFGVGVLAVFVHNFTKGLLMPYVLFILFVKTFKRFSDVLIQSVKSRYSRFDDQNDRHFV